MRRACSSVSLRSRPEPRRLHGWRERLKSSEPMPIDPNNHSGDASQEELSMSLDAAPIERLHPDDATRTDDEIPTVPPPEVLDACAAAAAHGAALSARGRRIVFELLADGGVAIELRNRDGRTLNVLTPSELLDVATRGSTDQP